MNIRRIVPLLRFWPLLFALLALPARAQIDRSYKTTPLMRLEVQTLVKMLEHYHYNKQAVASADYPKVISEYMGELDPQHLFFTAEDEQAFLRQYGPRIETDLAYLGNIDAAFAIFRIYEERVQTRAQWLFAELGKELDLAGHDFYQPDRSKSSWPAAGAESDDLWQRRLKFELIQEMLGNKPSEDAKQTIRKRYERMLKNIADYEASDLEEFYLSSLTKMYDPHSSYLSADTLEDFSIQMRLSLVGIGAVLGLEDDGYCVVREVVPGGPADLSGEIKTNDKIIAVQQDKSDAVEIIGMKLRRIVDMIRGEKDSKVRLTILPHDATDSTKTRQVLITRDLIKLNSARATAAIYDVPASENTTLPIGVITLNSFYDGSSGSEDGADEHRNTAAQDVAELLGKLKTAGVQAVVMDLRRNGGGLLSEAIEMTGLFIPKGPVVQVRDSLGRLNVDNDEDPRVVYDGPLAVLTSRFSASASEIFAGALQNYGRAVIIGDSSTHGKGTVQAVLEMKNYLARLSPDVSRAGAAKLTIQKFYLPNGVSTQQKGVVPDIALPSIDDFLPIGEADLPHALVWDEIRPTRFDGRPLAPGFVQPLVAASRERQAQLEEFAYLKQNIERFKTRQEQKLVSLNIEERRVQKTSDDEFSKQQDAERERLAKGNFPEREIKLDSVLAAEASGAKQPTPTAELDEGDTDAANEDSKVKFDIHLRESLRVVTDAVRLSRDPTYWADGRAPITTAGYSSNKG